jgi:hypothetical protein
VDDELYERLAWWRRDRAERDGVPAYVICGNKTLRDIAARRPQDERALADVWGAIAKADFSGTRDFDSKTGYRSRSFLTVPMRNHEHETIGVLQLINAQDPRSGEIVAF